MEDNTNHLEIVVGAVVSGIFTIAITYGICKLMEWNVDRQLAKK